MENDLCKTKQLLGDMMNLIYEEGGDDLAEKITNLMMHSKKSS